MKVLPPSDWNFHPQSVAPARALRALNPRRSAVRGRVNYCGWQATWCCGQTTGHVEPSHGQLKKNEAF
jgi:hypothetical protein